MIQVFRRKGCSCSTTTNAKYSMAEVKSAGVENTILRLYDDVINQTSSPGFIHRHQESSEIKGWPAQKKNLSQSWCPADILFIMFTVLISAPDRADVYYTQHTFGPVQEVFLLDDRQGSWCITSLLPKPVRMIMKKFRAILWSSLNTKNGAHFWQNCHTNHFGSSHLHLAVFISCPLWCLKGSFIIQLAAVVSTGCTTGPHPLTWQNPDVTAASCR